MAKTTINDAAQLSALNGLLSAANVQLTTDQPVYATIDGTTVKMTKAADGAVAVEAS